MTIPLICRSEMAADLIYLHKKAHNIDICKKDHYISNMILKIDKEKKQILSLIKKNLAFYFPRYSRTHKIYCQVIRIKFMKFE